MKNNNAIVFWRIVFTYMIVAFHFSTTFPWMTEVGVVPGWYLAVEFFFLVSGYLIYAKFDDQLKRYGSAVRFTLHRFATIWPEYIISFILTFTAIVCLGKNKLPVIPLIFDSKFEILLLQGIGLDRGWDYINPTLWYLSVMILSGFIIFFFLKYLKRFFVGYLAPALIILFLFLIVYNVGDLDVAVIQPGENVNYPLFRGLAEMCLGMYACMLTGWMKDHGDEKIWKCTGALSMVAAIIVSTYAGHSRFDLLVLALLFVGVSAAFLPGGSDHPFIKKWSGITLEIYLLHELFRTHIFPALFSRDNEIGQKLLIMLLYMVAVTLAAVLLHLCFYGVRSVWKKEKR